mgnify:CR=1 FL=1
MLLIFACNFKCVKFYLAPLIIGHLGAVILSEQEQVAKFEKSARYCKAGSAFAAQNVSSYDVHC